MGIADDTKKLGEDIIASHDMRVKAIGELVEDTHNLLEGFQSEHKEMADKLGADLVRGEEDRLKDFKAMMSDIEKFVADVVKGTYDMLKRFQSEHKEMADKLRADLAEGEEDRKNMSEEQARALADFVTDLTKDVGNMITGIQKDHKEMADKLRADLAKGEEDRLESFKPMMAEIQKGVEEIETYVRNKLKEFSDAHAEMSEELKKDLARYVDGMVKATKGLMSDIQARQKERNAEVADLLEEFNTEREKMAANWQALSAKMANKRGAAPKVEAEIKVRPVQEAVEEVVSEVEGDLQKRVLGFINEHQEGVKVGDMEEPLSATRMRLGQVAKKLLKEDMVRKEGSLYFPL